MIPIDLLRPYKAKDLVRIGSRYDGGYILPAAVIPNIDAVLSFGLYYNWDFEKAILEQSPQLKKMVIGDPFTPIASLYSMMFLYKRMNGASQAVENSDTTTAITPKKSILDKIAYATKKMWLYTRKFLAFQSFLSNNKAKVVFLQKGVSGLKKERMEGLDYFFSLVSFSNHLLIKMDIEGDEYTLDIAQQIDLKKVECLLIEFHEIDKNYVKLNAIIEQLQQHGLFLVHTHLNNSSKLINNCPFTETVELSFVKASYLENGMHKVVAQKYPIENLDYPCEPSKMDIELYFN